MLGYRDSFDELAKRYRQSDDPGIRKTEKLLLDSVTADFEKVWLYNLRRDGRTAQQELSGYQARPGSPLNNVASSTGGMVKTIRTAPDLNEVCLAFLSLRDSAGVQFRMFDFDAVEKWCGENKKQCQ